MKVRDDQMCSYCNDVVDYIEHFFFDCPTIKIFWNYIEQYILITFDIQTHLTVVDVLFGIKQHNHGKVKTKRHSGIVDHSVSFVDTRIYRSQIKELYINYRDIYYLSLDPI